MLLLCLSLQVKTASTSDDSAAVAASTSASLVAVVYRKKRLVFQFGFLVWFFTAAFVSVFHPPVVEWLVLESEDRWSLERWMRELQVIKSGICTRGYTSIVLFS